MSRRCVTLAIVLGALVLPAQASATQYGYCTDMMIDAYHTCRHGSDHYVVGLEGKSRGTAYAQVYTTFQDGSRSSALATSPGPGQLAGIYWSMTAGLGATRR